tara:strand:- start:245 stop:1117 length:873 start_codon:yes stop_codon:yes gene_type:complete
MIDLKRNTKGELVEATGLNSHKWRLYTPNQDKDFKISRSKFEDFLKCEKCFYLQVVKGLQPSGMPKFKLNELTDTLLKKEFDECRVKKISHRKLIEKNLDHIIPFDAGLTKITNSKKQVVEIPLIDVWRDSIHKGIKARYKNTNILLGGGIDDIWINTKTKELIIVDYKSQASKNQVSQETYFGVGNFHESYKTQLNFYAYVFKKMKKAGEINHEISKDSYLYVVNGLESENGFNGNIKFTEDLIYHKIETDYLEDEFEKMIKCINSTEIPTSNKSCKNCAYANQYAKLK